MEIASLTRCCTKESVPLIPNVAVGIIMSQFSSLCRVLSVKASNQDKKFCGNMSSCIDSHIFQMARWPQSKWYTIKKGYTPHCGDHIKGHEKMGQKTIHFDVHFVWGYLSLLNKEKRFSNHTADQCCHCFPCTMLPGLKRANWSPEAGEGETVLSC